MRLALPAATAFSPCAASSPAQQPGSARRASPSWRPGPRKRSWPGMRCCCLRHLDPATGALRDVGAFAARAREAGALALFDFSDTAGALPAALEHSGVEAAVGRGGGFLGGGPGAPAWVHAIGDFTPALSAMPAPSALALAALDRRARHVRGRRYRGARLEGAHPQRPLPRSARRGRSVAAHPARRACGAGAAGCAGTGERAGGRRPVRKPGRAPTGFPSPSRRSRSAMWTPGTQRRRSGDRL